MAAALVLAAGLVLPVLLDAGQAPDGTEAFDERTVWDGIFTEEQASRGRLQYARHCSQCHGATLQGGEHRALAGDRFWTSWQGLTVDRLLTYVSTSMPHSEDGSTQGTLGVGVYGDLVAHILHANAFPAGSIELSPASVAGVRIVRREGPTELPDGSFVHVVGCLARGPGRDWTLQRGSAPARVLSGEPDNIEAPLGDRAYALLFVITSLDRFAGHRMSVRGSLVGGGGATGVNVTTITSVSETCD
jgi:S-disulfanyl-L-cysteine oxidoreductase SoxD